MRQIAGGYSMCKVCGFLMSHEQPGAGAEVVSLDAVREKNFRLICKTIKEKFPQAKTILDVGSSTGHFLNVASNEGFSVTGLEPDVHLADNVRAQGYNVINEFFPHAKSPLTQTYDIIIFNDSFEHIPNLQEVLRGIKEHLKSTGVVIINLPTSDGIIFKTAFLLNKLGIQIPFNRLWQKGFASPHLHYFNERNLKQFFENNGFVMQYSSSLYYYTVKGLWGRISCKSPFIVSIFAWLCMVILYPLFTFYSDCFMACFSFSVKEGCNL
jgi:2-polyprenyl-3-methyl-5-hydroxy-6-metoxy-1,4-benzoquinol methylase